jgi:hypothetical protein
LFSKQGNSGWLRKHNQAVIALLCTPVPYLNLPDIVAVILTCMGLDDDLAYTVGAQERIIIFSQ